MKKISFLAILFFLFGGLYLLFSSDYYEYDAESEIECLPGEEYDAEYKVCYFDFYCETDEECNEIDERYGQVLDALAEEYQKERHDYHSHDGDTQSGEKSVHPRSNDGKIQELLQILLPERYRVRISTITQHSDGVDGVLAYVEPSSKNGSTWKLGYDPEDAFLDNGNYNNPKQLLTTLIHEYAHILALNDTQVKHVGVNVEYIECHFQEIIIDEGCAKSNSHLTKFIDKFWDESLREEAHQAQIQGRDQEFAIFLYETSPSHFVTEYAATNAVEDFAESFALFIMESKKDTTDTIAAQKKSFFYSIPEFVNLRKYMRGGVIKILEGK